MSLNNATFLSCGRVSGRFCQTHPFGADAPQLQTIGLSQSCFTDLPLKVPSFFPAETTNTWRHVGA